MGWNFFDTTGNSKKITLTGSIDLPVGTVVPFASNTIPVGWRLCDGQALSRTGFADLFSLLNTSYGVGDGSTTFNLPDLRGRSPIGKNAGTFPTLGGVGGAETHTLSGAESGTTAHTHGGATATGNASTTHSHGSGSYTTNNVPNAYTAPIQNGVSGTSFFGVTNVVNTAVTGTSDVNSNSHTHTLTVPTSSAAAATNAHNNLQPYQVVNWIIKVFHSAASSGPNVVVPGAELSGGYGQITANTSGAGDKISITVVGDGVTPVMLEGHARSATSTTASSQIILQIWDGPGATGSMYMETVTIEEGATGGVPVIIKRRVPAWVGPRTFYLYLNNTLGTPGIQAAANAPAYLRATWAG